MVDNQQDIVTIDGKDYELSKLPLDIRNTIFFLQNPN